MFQSKWFLLASFTLSCGFVGLCWEALSGEDIVYFFWISFVICFVGVLTLLISFQKRIMIIWTTGFNKVDIKEIGCFTNLAILLLYLSVVTIIGIIFHQEYGSVFSVIFTYAEAIFTLALTVTQDRLHTYEVGQKKVNISFIIIVSFCCYNFISPQELLEAKKNFVRFISHEIRTPLNTLVMGLKLIRRGLERGEARSMILENLESVEDSCGIAVETLNDILSFEKLDAGLMTLDKEPVQALPFIEACVRLFSMQVLLVL